MFDIERVIELQEGYKNLMSLNGTDVCALVAPFCERYGINQVQALLIARDELPLKSLAELLNSGRGVAEVPIEGVKTPSRAGWYLCKHSNMNTNDKVEEDTGRRYRVCFCGLKLLYWNGSMWVSSPDSYDVIENGRVLDWVAVPEEFNLVHDEYIKQYY